MQTENNYLILANKDTTLSEFNIIAAVMIKPDYLDDIRGIVGVSDFQTEKGRAVFEAICQLANEKEQIEISTVQERARQNGVDVPHEWFKEMLDLSPSAHMCISAAHTLRLQSVGIKTRIVAEKLSEAKITASEAILELNQLQEQKIIGLPTPTDDQNAFLDMLSEISSGNKKLFLSTGYTELDEMLSGGLANGGMITIAARPAVGKSTVGLDIADNVAATGVNVLYVSLEMPREQLNARRHSRITGIPFGKIQRADLDDEEWKRISMTAAKLSRIPLQIHDKPASFDDIDRMARSTKSLGLLIIDHVGLVKSTEKTKSRYEEVSMLSHRLKQLALSLGIPVLSLCQLNRESVADGGNKRPTMANLRDSGAWEEDSDVVILLDRPELRKPKDQQPNGFQPQDIEFIIDKNRHGRTGIVTMSFFGALSRVIEKNFGTPISVLGTGENEIPF